MKVDKKSQHLLSEIQGIAFRVKDTSSDRNYKIYSEIAYHGVESKGNLSIESKHNHKKLKDFSPFQKFLESSSVKNNELSQIHDKISTSLKEQKESYISQKDMNRLLTQEGVLKRIAKSITNDLNIVINGNSNNTILSNPSKILKLSNEIKKARDKELIKSVLLTKNGMSIGSYFHLISKGIKNIENPQSNKLIPSDVLIQAGMIQIGYALNELLLINRGETVADLSPAETIKIKKLAQRGDHSTDFINKCKDMAKSWTIRNQELISAYVEKYKDGVPTVKLPSTSKPNVSKYIEKYEVKSDTEESLKEVKENLLNKRNETTEDKIRKIKSNGVSIQKVRLI